ncbi:hypothetical protein ACEPUI_32205, partial [Pseudomonas aeruginosa]
TERSGGNGAVAVFMACYDCFFVQSMPRASKQQARYAVGRCLMLWSSNDVTQQGSRPKTKLAGFLFLLISAHEYSNAIYPRKRLSAGCLAFARASPAWIAPVSSLFGL